MSPRTLSILALIAGAAALALSLRDDYSAGYAAGQASTCSQLTDGAGELRDGVCEVFAFGAWLEPRLEIRGGEE